MSILIAPTYKVGEKYEVDGAIILLVSELIAIYNRPCVVDNSGTIQ